MKTNFEIIKDFIFNTNIKNLEPPIEQGVIEEAIKNVKTLFSLGDEMVSRFLTGGTQHVTNLTGSEYDLLEKYFKSNVNIKHHRGEGLTGKDQRLRDNKWWERYKNNNDLYYWENHKKYIEDTLPFSSRKTLDDDTDMIMGYLGNPKEEENFERYGMVVGHVQSGKTGNYSALINKAADAGYKVIIVIAGALNNLRNQTQSRLCESFIGLENGVQVGVGKSTDFKEHKIPISLTNSQTDFKKKSIEVTRALRLEVSDSPFVLVIKKNASTLKNVIDWLEQQNIIAKDHAMLLIDDESDYASINTKKDDEDPTTINRNIRKLLSLFNKKAYVAYTATPYANIFIKDDEVDDNLGKDLFPEDFIYALDAPSNYFGAAKIFLDPDKKYLVPIYDYEDTLPTKHKKSDVVEELPESLEEAIRLFCLNVAIRHLRRQEEKHNSMMIHVTRFTDIHHNVFILVSEYLEELQKIIKIYGKKENNSRLKILKATFTKYYIKNYVDDSKEFEFTWEEVLNELITTIHLIQTREVHNNSRIPLEYDEKSANNYIVIGGTSLARGYTLEGLSVSYFLRSTVFYDTLMQMGRWFGYRDGYQDLCKIFMPEQTIDYFSNIIEATIDLVDDLSNMQENKQTPKDFGLAVKYHPDSALQVTAANKSRNTETIVTSMRLSGRIKETSWLNYNEKIIQHNLNVVKSFISDLPKDKRSYNFRDNNDIKNTIWSNIDRNKITQFLNDFTCFDIDRNDVFGLRSRMPLQFIKKYVEDNKTDWDIVIHTGGKGVKEEMLIDGEYYGKYQFRTINLKNNRLEFIQRQVSSGDAEEATLTSLEIEQIKNKKHQKKIQKTLSKENGDIEVDEILRSFSARKEARRLLKRPVLMLHLIKADIIENTNELEKKRVEDNLEIAAFSISFPSSIGDENVPITIRVNSVYLKNLELDGDYDD